MYHVLCNGASRVVSPKQGRTWNFLLEDVLDEYSLVVNVGVESAFMFPTSKTFKTFSLDCSKLGHNDDSKDLLVAAQAKTIRCVVGRSEDNVKFKKYTKTL